MQAIYTKTMDIPKGRKQSFGASGFDATKTATIKSNKTSESKMSPVTTAQNRVLQNRLKNEQIKKVAPG